MKKLLFLCLILISIFTGCQKESDVDIKGKIEDVSKEDIPDEFEDNLYTTKYSMDESYEEKEITLYINPVKLFPDGTLYEMNTKEQIPLERLPIYLYVQEDKIYRIWQIPEDIEAVEDENELLQESMIVYQKENLEDSLEENAAGDHHYIVADTETIESHYYRYNDYANPSGYWEAFVWTVDKELLQYRSGFNAGADLLELSCAAKP